MNKEAIQKKSRKDVKLIFKDIERGLSSDSRKYSI